MSKENAQAFLEKIKTDADLKQQVRQVRQEARAMAEKRIRELADDHGLSFEPEHMHAAVKEKLKARYGEHLSDDDLDRVAGGGTWETIGTEPYRR